MEEAFEDGKNIKYIFVDMDGVLADFLRLEEYIGHPITNDDKGHTQYDLRKKLTNKKIIW